MGLKRVHRKIKTAVMSGPVIKLMRIIEKNIKRNRG